MLFSSQRRTARFLYNVADAALTALAFEAAYQTRANLEPFTNEFYFQPGEKALLLGFSLLAVVVIGHWLDVHNSLNRFEARTVISGATRQAGCSIVSLVIFEYALRLNMSRGFLVFFAAYLYIFLLVFRWYGHKLVARVSKEFGAQHFVLVVGVGQQAMEVARQLHGGFDQGIRLRGFVDPDAAANGSEICCGEAYPVLVLSEVESALRQHVIDEVVLAIDPARLAELANLFHLCKDEGVRTRVALELPELGSDLRLEFLGTTPLLTFNAAPNDQIKLLAKRIIDLALGTVGLVLAFPVMLAAAAAIKLTSPGPLIFRQERCGLNGRRFVCYKFRSMVADAEQRKGEVLHLSRRSTATKIARDPRLTPIGGFLRRFSIDELPQLFNVIRGDMSIVGPRPAIPSEVAQYQPWQRRRLRMRPGLTCLWAVNGRDAVDFETWMKLDMQYIDNWSLVLDWKLILKTIPVVMLGKGAS